jgi:hypothetical protein
MGKHCRGGATGMAEDSPTARLLWRREGSTVVEEVSAAQGEGEAVDLQLKWDEQRTRVARGGACQKWGWRR